jgi:5-dehydro-2-deoxygluconokinase
MNRLELLALGRSGVDLYGQDVGGRLEDCSGFAKYVGGSPTNTAIGASRLGLSAGLISRVGADHMGRFVREQLVREGVDVRGVSLDPDRLTALVLLGIRDRDTFPLIFYRENCADMALSADEIDPDLAASANNLLINGTHLSRPGVYEASLRAASLVKAAGGRVILDVDYRPVLWGLTARDMGENRFVAHDAVTDVLQRVLPICDLIVGTEEEMHILGGQTETIAALRAIRDKTQATLVCKLGPKGCAAFPGEVPDTIDAGVFVPGFEVEVFNVLGAGDAFMAGFLRGWLRGMPLPECCRLANACGAIVVSRHGCAPAMPTWIELEAFLASDSHLYRLRDDPELEHIHWATTRARQYEDLTILAVDHRSQFEDMAMDIGADPARIRRFKELALSALNKVGQGDHRFGILLDGRYGFDALAAAADHPYWIGRCIELPRSRPVEFESSPDVATELAAWPLNQVVKVLVFYHPDDETELRERQERQVLRLFDACRKTRHELLLEIIPPSDMAADKAGVVRTMDRFYDLGVRPDWWKLEPMADPAVWRKVEEVIQRRDPLCRGALILGLQQPVEALEAAFAATADIGVVKGFAIGRAIWQQPAQDWLSGKIDDATVASLLAANFGRLVTAWRASRRKARVA